MCRISKETILKANAKMKRYTIGQSRKNDDTNSFTVATHVHGRVYSNTLTVERVNDIFGRALTNMDARHGKTL